MQLQNNKITSTSFKLRIWNEVATVFLFAIVFLIVLKNNTDFVWGMLALIIFSVTLVLAIKIYKKRREKSSESGVGKNSSESGVGSSEKEVENKK